ncbi:MAG: rRNA maturation RNase YbeY [Gemmatimonadota bacterium]
MAVELLVNDESGGLPPGLDPAVVERAARAALTDRGVEEGELSLTLLDDPAMAALNRRWKGRSEPTDVLAFSLHEPGQPIMGDVYLGVERAAAQAAELGEPPARELARLAVHGTLHVLGWDHPELGREGSEMWRHQERILAGLGMA